MQSRAHNIYISTPLKLGISITILNINRLAYIEHIQYKARTHDMRCQFYRSDRLSTALNPWQKKAPPITANNPKPAISTAVNKKMSLSKTESDVILNRANVALSRSQRLVASWLPQSDELSHTKTEEELQREEDEIFTAVPETYVPCYGPSTYTPTNNLT